MREQLFNVTFVRKEITFQFEKAQMSDAQKFKLFHIDQNKTSRTNKVKGQLFIFRTSCRFFDFTRE